MQFYKLYKPPIPLDSLTKGVEVYHIKWDKEEKLPDPYITCLANTEQNLYFYLNDPVKIIPAIKVEIEPPPVVVTGPKFKPVGLLFGKDHLMIKVGFHPTGTYRLLGIDMQKLVNTGLDATVFWGTEVKDILHELRAMDSYDAMVNRIFVFIRKKFDETCRPCEPIDDVALQMFDQQNNYSLEEWASRACLSLRQFERNFIKRVGIAPKLFVRINRFEYAMKIKNDNPEKNWTEIAQESGYTDSSHILREFKEFAEFPPSQFYEQQTSGFSEFPTG